MLDRLSISYQTVEHPPAATIADCKEIEKVLDAPICKNLLLTDRKQKQFFLLLMPGDKPFSTREVHWLLGCPRLSFATAEKMQEYLHLTPGSVSLFGLLFDPQHLVRLVIDQEVWNAPYLCAHPCINTATLKVKMKEIQDKLLPTLGISPEIIELAWPNS